MIVFQLITGALGGMAGVNQSELRLYCTQVYVLTGSYSFRAAGTADSIL
jgi:hypothetical protein